MTEREKVLKGLNCCSAMSGDECRKCPYSHECRDTDLLYGIPHLAADALALLKEQEAVPISQREIAHMIFWCCGSCGVPITSGDKFCRNCGKAVKWDD